MREHALMMPLCFYYDYSRGLIAIAVQLSLLTTSSVCTRCRSAFFGVVRIAYGGRAIDLWEAASFEPKNIPSSYPRFARIGIWQVNLLYLMYENPDIEYSKSMSKIIWNIRHVYNVPVLLEHWNSLIFGYSFLYIIIYMILENGVLFCPWFDVSIKTWKTGFGSMCFDTLLHYQVQAHRRLEKI